MSETKKSTVKDRSRSAVGDHLKAKLDRYSTKMPRSAELLAESWVCKRSWGPSYAKGYSITIRAYARVIHIHTQGKKIARAHLIHKLMEEDHQDFPNAGKKLTPKLALGKGEFSPSTKAKIIGKAPPDTFGTGAHVERALKAGTHDAMNKLNLIKESIPARIECIIYDDTRNDIKQRRAYTNGSKALADPLLSKMVTTINEAFGANTVMGWTDQ